METDNATTREERPAAGEPELPGPEDVGYDDQWTLPTDGGTDTITFDGVYLGHASSRRHEHDLNRNPHVDVDKPGCRRCRWFEPRIFRENGGQQRYLVHFARPRHEWHSSGWEVVESLTTRHTGRVPFLSAPAARVLAQAAANDDDLEKAYANRAVS